ncbi:MFS transporter [Oceaniferula spumae]|uniref:MFS transporter n=1 Tax=Oceaniferula spumae TaxID=2979115 RepID=A0AAT9FKS1_9BACT
MSHSPSRWQHVVLIIGILLIGMNLRPSITALSALAERMHYDGLSRETIGSLTTIPLILFGVVGLWAGWIGKLMGFARALGLGLFLIGIGCWIRSLPGDVEIFSRFGGTILLGAGIALGNVVLPGLVKSRYPNHVGILTSLYATSMNLGAACGIAFSVPLAELLPGGWRSALAAWGGFAIIVLLLWSPQMFARPTTRKSEHPLAGVMVLAKQIRAWQVAAFMGLQSWVFYCSVAWLPTLLQSKGMAETTAANWVVGMQLLGCAASLTIPTLAGRSKSQSSWVVGCALFNVVGLTGTLLLPGIWQIISLLILGLGLNAGFGLVLLLIPLRSKNPETAASLSSMAQAAGYLFSSPGPWLVGLLSTTAGGWPLAFGVVIGIAVLGGIAGFLAGRPGELSLD